MKRVPIKGYEGYEIDNMGNVYIPTRTITVYDHGRIYNRTFKSRVTKGCKSSNGYYKVTLYNGTTKKTEYVHRLVAEAFVPNPNGYNEINHKDENGRNNCADNLEWCTHIYNCRYGTAVERRVAQTRGRKMSEEQRLKMAKDRKEYYATHTPAFVVASIRKRIPVLGKSIEDNEWTYYESMCHAAKAVGIDATDVRRVCNGKFKQSHGYMFKYANEREAI